MWTSHIQDYKNIYLPKRQENRYKGTSPHLSQIPVNIKNCWL